MNLDLSSLTYRITIVSILSLLALSLSSQDLEEETIPALPKPKVTQTLEPEPEMVAPPQAAPAPAAPTEVVERPAQTEQRNPETYRKEAYIHAMLRHTY